MSLHAVRGVCEDTGKKGILCYHLEGPPLQVCGLNVLCSLRTWHEYEHVTWCRSSRDYYKQYLKGAFINHSDEDHPERVQQLFEGARSNAEYLLAKVCKFRGFPSS